MTEAVTQIHAGNAAAWNQTRDWYREHADRARPVLADGGSTLHPVELRMLDGLTPLAQWCERAVHLQCAAGLDTLSLLNHGAQNVVGVDIATDLIEVATELAERVGVGDRASFRSADVLDLPDELDGTADLVYTGKGAVHWIFDLSAWGRSVASTLRPGGIFALFDFHAMMWMFRSDLPQIQASGVSYFAPRVNYTNWADGHVGDLGIPPDELASKQLRPWPPSAVIQALLDAGLTLRAFGEYPDSMSPDWSAYPQWQQGDRRTVATTYSLLASKPADD